MGKPLAALSSRVIAVRLLANAFKDVVTRSQVSLLESREG